MIIDQVPFLLFLGLFMLLFFLLGYFGKKIRIPSIIIYIVMGILLAFIINDKETLHVIAEIGIVLLFFLLGLEFRLTRMMEVSGKVLPGGVMDIVLCLGGGMGVALLFGLDILPAFLVGSVAYASSSSITAKLLEEEKRLAFPETEYILALLIFEDIAAPIVVALLAGIYGGSKLTPSFLAVVFLKIIILIAGAVIIGYFCFRKLDKFVERHVETDFMPLLLLGVAFAYGGIALALGLSEVLGAFLAGIILSETGHSKSLEHLVIPVRDITLPFFFFYFGMTITVGEGLPFVGMLIVLGIWSILAKMAVGYLGGRSFGLNYKAAARSSFSLGQRGEFSAIIAAIAPASLRIFSGVYILLTAFIGVVMFYKAPGWAKAIGDRYFEKEL